MNQSRHDFSERLESLVDDAFSKALTKRSYLGASQLGKACDRAIQYDYIFGSHAAPKQQRIFAAGHLYESLVISWLQNAGFIVKNTNEQGEQYGFNALDGKFQGHVDGIVIDGPEKAELDYPCIFECKSMANKYWQQLKKQSLPVARPEYAAQIALYQAYMNEQFPNICNNPALFVAINKDSQTLYFESVPFDAELAQRSSDRAVKILSACDADEMLPRIAHESSFYVCKMCQFRDKCWELQ